MVDRAAPAWPGAPTDASTAPTVRVDSLPAVASIAGVHGDDVVLCGELRPGVTLVGIGARYVSTRGKRCRVIRFAPRIGYDCPVAASESDFDRIFAALAKRKVRYLVVGGVAVVLHGVPRFTADLDLVLALDAANVLAALESLAELAYRPRAPVPLRDFADPVLRRAWIDEKGLTVLSLWSPDHPATEIDLFVEEPFPFDEVFARATPVDLGTHRVTVASIADLIELKRRADRPMDREDTSGCSRWGKAAIVDEATRRVAFAEHAREQQRAWLRLTYRQRLDWLWQAKLFAARALQAAEARRVGKTQSRG